MPDLPVAAPAEPSSFKDVALARRMLCSIAYEAERYVQDGLSPKSTAIRIRDAALLALDADHDEALEILRGDYAR